MNFRIIPLEKKYEDQARDLIISGFREFMVSHDFTERYIKKALHDDLEHLYNHFAKYLFLVAITPSPENCVIACGGIECNKWGAEHRRLSVRKDWRSHGLGKCIFELLHAFYLEKLKPQGCRYEFSRTTSNLVAAVRFHTHMGAKLVKTKKIWDDPEIFLFDFDYTDYVSH